MFDTYASSGALCWSDHYDRTLPLCQPDTMVGEHVKQAFAISVQEPHKLNSTILHDLKLFGV